MPSRFVVEQKILGLWIQTLESIVFSLQFPHLHLLHIHVLPVDKFDHTYLWKRLFALNHHHLAPVQSLRRYQRIYRYSYYSAPCEMEHFSFSIGGEEQVLTLSNLIR